MLPSKQKRLILGEKGVEICCRIWYKDVFGGRAVLFMLRMLLAVT